jgi:hypothetical protein
MMFHDSEMDGVTSRKLPVPENNLFRALGNSPINCQHLIDNSEEGIECWLDGIATVNCNISMQDLLKHFGICNQALAVAHQLLEPTLRVALVGMRRAHEIHRNVRVDENHLCSSVTYPFSISANIPPMSLTG